LGRENIWFCQEIHGFRALLKERTYPAVRQNISYSEADSPRKTAYTIWPDSSSIRSIRLPVPELPFDYRKHVFAFTSDFGFHVFIMPVPFRLRDIIKVHHRAASVTYHAASCPRLSAC
jgi:hypothetical protein